MLSLILVLISIALFSLFMILGVNDINFNTLREGWHEDEIKNSTAIISTAIDSYKISQRKFPDTDSWKSQLFPGYGTMPTLSIDGDFSLYENSGDYYLCIEAEANTSNKNLFVNMEDKYSGVYIKGTSCGVSDVIDAQNDYIYLSYQF